MRMLLVRRPTINLQSQKSAGPLIMATTSTKVARSSRFIDIGANLLDPVFDGVYRGKQKHDSDFSTMLERAKATGLHKIMVTAGTVEEAADALKLVKNDNSGLLCSTAGIHPTRAKVFETRGHQRVMEGLRKTLSEGAHDKSIVAIGECGLDYDRLHFCPKEVQLRHFPRHFELAEEYNLPMFLHDRNTGGDFVDIIMRNRDRMPLGGVVHSYTGSLEEARALLDVGLYIGINGCSLKTEENLAVLREIPMDRIMLETDAPWCDIRATHASHKFVSTTWPTKKPERFEADSCVKGRNEPCHIRQVAEVVAGVKELTVEEVIDAVYDNTVRVFPSLAVDESDSA